MPFSTPSGGDDLPTPWTLTDGPRPLLQGYVDGKAWRFTLERDGVERSLIVAVSRHAVDLSERGEMPVETRAAIATDGRSEAARVAQLDEVASCVALGRAGYLRAWPGLARVAQM